MTKQSHKLIYEIASSTFGLLAMTFLLCAPAYAANKNVGTSGAQFLKIGAGARSTAMGEAFTGIADDVNAVYHNPAGLATLERPELTAMHTQWLQGLDYEFGAFAYPTKIGTFGLSAATLKTDEIARRAADESLQGSFENLDAAYGLSYARPIGDTFYTGATVRFIRQEIADVSANAISGDVGVLKKFAEKPYSVGLAVRHFGQGVKFQDETDPLPMTVDLGFGLHLMDNRLLLGADVLHPRDNDLQYAFGSEWKQNLGSRMSLALRAGYNSSGTDADGTTGFSLGGGIGIGRFAMDVAWVPFGDLGNTFRYAAHFRF